MTHDSIVQSISGKRIDLKLTKKDLAREAGVNYTYLTEILSGKKKMGVPTLLKLNKVLNFLKINS